MRISQLSLTAFRTYSKRSFTCDPNLTVVVGSNGSGKTNILEAIHLLATGESWRGETTEEMIAFEEGVAHVLGVTEQATSDKRQATSIQKSNLRITLTRGFLQDKRVVKVKYKVDGVAKRKSDFVGRLKIVLFEPQSLMIVIGDPTHRRRFLDETLVQTDPEYRNDLLIYEKSLRVRNRLLDAIRERKAHPEQLAYWERAMVKHGGKLQEFRIQFIDWINQHRASKGLSLQGQSFFELQYEPSLISEERLDVYREREIAAGFSLVGPQRDDFVIAQSRQPSAVSRQLAAFGSRGEQRMAVLMLKLAEAQWIEEKTGESPVLLLDDIYSELDDEHDQMVGELVRGRQTIIAATETPPNFSEYGKTINLDEYR